MTTPAMQLKRMTGVYFLLNRGYFRGISRFSISSRFAISQAV